MFPYLFKIGWFELRLYSLMLIIAVLLSIFLISRRSKSLGYDPKKTENIIIFTFIGGILGARIYYVLFNWDFFRENLREIPAVWHGGLAIHGGVILGAAAFYFLCRYYRFPFFKFTDMAAPALLLSQGLGRFGNFANGEAHGVPVFTPPEIIFSIKPTFQAFWRTLLNAEQLPNTPQAITTLYYRLIAAPIKVVFEGKDYILREYAPWGISFPDTYSPQAYREFGVMPVHPTFFYEMILNFIGAAVLFNLWKKDSNIGAGAITALYFAMYALIRGFVTFFRADDLMLGFLRAPHIASILFLLIALAIYLSRKNRKGALGD
ncbi:MAG: prolipoprotein diacylglyceryl transferase [Deferribacteraceae bacterium]|jgi:phosphatidylglycerol:prolipoprotein diacylglycerol transferase|nr:prolipoprotein diacylglyceryl transferase [Deferribacteraceae bacterium]